MRLRRVLTTTLLALACVGAAQAQPGAVERLHQGNRTSENVPSLPARLIEDLNRYQNTRGASFAGWTRDGCLLVSTRFAETAQAHRVCAPLGMREQLTFYPEPVNSLTVAPGAGNGFVFGKDVGGNEFWQLHWFDLATRQTRLLTDGKSRNQAPLFAHDGKQLAYSSTLRNGRDTDVWVMDFPDGKARTVVTEGGQWSAQDFSPDGKQLLVLKYVSAGESYPGLVDLASGKLTLFPVDGGKASISDFRFSRDGRAVYFVSDEIVGGKPQEFRTLRRHEPATGKFEVLSDKIPWDVDQLALSEDGRRLLFVSNEDGIGKLHALSLPGHQEIPLPALPAGAIGGVDFSPDGKRIALAINSATSPSDVYVIDIDARKLARWTRSEVGGLDSSKFVAPALVRYPTFDQVDGKPRTIPAFYYKPAAAAAGKPLPVLIQIHGGPETIGNKDQQGLPLMQHMAAKGWVCVAINYRLSPRDAFPAHVIDVKKAIAWISEHIADYGGDPARIVVAGHSAGGHLAAMMLACEWPQVAPDLPADVVKAAYAISGLFELEPLRHAPFLAPDLKLTAASARRLSPSLMPAPRHGGQLAAVVGGDESEEFRRQTRALRDAWGTRAVPVCEDLPGLNHYTVLHDLADPQGRSHALVRQLLGLRWYSGLHSAPP